MEEQRKEQGEQAQQDFIKEWNHRRNSRKKTLRAWFDEYAANGAITYTYTVKDGKGVYKWTKGELLKPEELITDAEIIADEQGTDTGKAKAPKAPKKGGKKPKKA